MNERIQELSDIAYKNHLKNNPESSFGRRTDYDTKFAELIVGHAIECVRDVLRDENSDLSYAGASQVQKRLREHFGVEE